MNQSRHICESLQEATDSCFACDRRLGKNPAVVITDDGAQQVYVGKECFGLIKAAGRDGYQPPLGGPRLFTLSDFGGVIRPSSYPFPRGGEQG